MQKNILILFTNYGTGHYMAAKAIYEHLINKYPNYNIKIMDPLSFSRPLINKICSKIGKLFATKFRKLRKYFYQKHMYQNYLKYSWFYTFFTTLFWNKKLEEKIINFNPKIIISTQAGPTCLIATHKHLFKSKLVSVFTDYSIHRAYTLPHKNIDIYCVPNKEIKKQMIKLGIKKSKISITGIPVHQQFMLKTNKQNKKSKPLFLFICGGGLGYKNAFKYFKNLLEINDNFSYIFVAGKNKKLKEKAAKLAKKYNKQGHIIGYTTNMDKLMFISDMIIGKPGGIITSESLNTTIPICAVEAIPGQETYNALFIEKNNFGFNVKNKTDFKLLLNKILTKKINLKEYQKNIENNFDKFNFINIDKI